MGARIGAAGTAFAALLAVEAFEITDGFGAMSNTYDPLDLLANALGVAAAWGLARHTSGFTSTAALKYRSSHSNAPAQKRP